MDQQDFFRLLLNLTPEWEVVEVKLNDSDEIDIFIRYKLDKAKCPLKNEICSIYDWREIRRWRHLNVLQYKSFINCKIPRVINSDGKVSTIEVPWSDFSDRYTYLFEAEVVKTLQLCKNQTKTARYLAVSYDIVNSIMKSSVERGLKNRMVSVTTTIGLDEKSFLKGQNFVTVLTDIDNGCVLDIEPDRTIKAGINVLDKTFTESQLKAVKVVVSDMSEAYMSVGKNKIPNAIQVADRFHLIKILNNAIDKTRKQEVRREKTLLANSKYALLKRPENLTNKQKMTFEAIDKANLRTARVWRAKENFRALFGQPDGTHAFISLNTWLQDVKNITIYQLEQVAKTFKKHLNAVINALWHNASNAMTERLNGGIQELKAIAKGYRNFENFRTAILFHYGKLNLHPPQNFP